MLPQNLQTLFLNNKKPFEILKRPDLVCTYAHTAHRKVWLNPTKVQRVVE